MEALNNINDVLHRIRVRLRPSRLPGSVGTYCARVNSEAVLGIEDVCSSLKLRGGFTGSYDDAVKIVNLFLNEAAYQLCDGYSVNLGYFSIHPSVGGYFKSVNEEPDRDKHPVRFRFRARGPMRDLSRYIGIEVEQPETEGYIDTFVNLDSAGVNETVTPGGFFTLTGVRLKIRGENPECGLYFVSADEPSRRFKADGVFPVNTSSKLFGKAPPLPQGEYCLEIKTQHTTGSIDLKEPRTVRGDFTLRVE